MTTIRNFAYAALLAFTSLTFMPSAASAQESAHGTFTLAHDVRWQNAAVPAGDYRFSYQPSGGGGMLMLSKLSGARGGFILMVHDTDEAKPTDTNLLLLQNTAAGSYVSAMQLPEVGTTLRFPVPARATEKQIATAVTTASASAQ